MPKMLRLNDLTEYWKGLSGKIWNVEDDGTTCDILINKSDIFSLLPSKKIGNSTEFPSFISISLPSPHRAPHLPFRDPSPTRNPSQATARQIPTYGRIPQGPHQQVSPPRRHTPVCALPPQPRPRASSLRLVRDPIQVQLW